MPDLQIRDEEVSGQPSSEFFISFFAEQITVRELIRSRIYQEVQDHNHLNPTQRHRTLVAPTPGTMLQNAEAVGRSSPIDWLDQVKTATEAFEAGRIIILIDDQQAESLDQTFEIMTSKVVTFLWLTLLVGG